MYLGTYFDVGTVSTVLFDRFIRDFANISVDWNRTIHISPPPLVIAGSGSLAGPRLMQRTGHH